MTAVTDISDDMFETEVMRSILPVLVDFHAQWCAPCKAMAPALVDLAREYDGEIRIVKIDIEAAPRVAKAHGITSVPTFMLIHDGEVVARFGGMQTRSRIAAILDDVVGTGA